jgi:hypothetical protein
VVKESVSVSQTLAQQSVIWLYYLNTHILKKIEKKNN